jgi:adenosylmethionine-8-amino-7-oxononanoate aminotransferase
MSTPSMTSDSSEMPSVASGNAAEHLWMHFTRMSSFASKPVPTIERGEGAYIWDTNGRKYLDALSGLFVVQAGHGREELVEAAAAQARKLAFFPIWSFAHPTAIELADRLAAEAPGYLNKVFFSCGGGESVETAWKVIKQYFKLIGKPSKTKAISRAVAYHGTPHAVDHRGSRFQAALRATGTGQRSGAEHQLLPRA